MLQVCVVVFIELVTCHIVLRALLVIVDGGVSIATSLPWALLVFT